jgi:hypothetical protein
MPIEAAHSCVKLKPNVNPKNVFGTHKEKIWKEISGEHKINAEKILYIMKLIIII